jgi:putative peptidoglycan lipid II flippase
LGADPVPAGSLLDAVGAGLLAAAAVTAVAGAVIMGTARRPLLAAVRALRTPGGTEVHGG